MIKFIVGGANSGKTKFAISFAKRYPPKRIYIATGVPVDREMEEKIETRKKERGKDFETWEEPYEVSSLLGNISEDIKVIVFDCLTTWSANLLLKNKDVILYAKEFLEKLKNFGEVTFYIISNEVGMGIVPEYELSRKYREILGKINILFASQADEVYFMIAGIPWRIK